MMHHFVLLQVYLHFGLQAALKYQRRGTSRAVRMDILEQREGGAQMATLGESY